MSSFFAVDWSDMLGTVIQDAQSTQDMELMINAFETVQLMGQSGKG
jgi:hypothetical protein